jgi:hypothetical protein
MKLLDRLRSIIAQGESVASDELETVVPAARNFFPKWRAYSITKKVLAVTIPLALLGGLYAVGINGLQAAARHVFRDGDRPIVTQAEFKKLKGDVDKLRDDLAAKATKDDVAGAVKASSDALSQSLKANGPTMLEFNQLQDDVRQMQIEQEAARKKPAKASRITTGSTPPKKAKASPSLTDPSTWQILP